MTFFVGIWNILLEVSAYPEELMKIQAQKRSLWGQNVQGATRYHAGNFKELFRRRWVTFKVPICIHHFHKWTQKIYSDNEQKEGKGIHKPQGAEVKGRVSYNWLYCCSLFPITRYSINQPSELLRLTGQLNLKDFKSLGQTTTACLRSGWKSR